MGLKLSEQILKDFANLAAAIEHGPASVMTAPQASTELAPS